MGLEGSNKYIPFPVLLVLHQRRRIKHKTSKSILFSPPQSIKHESEPKTLFKLSVGLVWKLSALIRWVGWNVVIVGVYFSFEWNKLQTYKIIIIISLNESFRKARILKKYRSLMATSHVRNDNFLLTIVFVNAFDFVDRSCFIVNCW